MNHNFDIDGHYLAQWEQTHGWDYMNPPEFEEEQETPRCRICGTEIDKTDIDYQAGCCCECYNQVIRGLVHLHNSMYAPIDADDLWQIVEEVWDDAFPIAKERRERDAK